MSLVGKVKKCYILQKYIYIHSLNINYQTHAKAKYRKKCYSNISRSIMNVTTCTRVDRPTSNWDLTDFQLISFTVLNLILVVLNMISDVFALELLNDQYLTDLVPQQDRQHLNKRSRLQQRYVLCDTCDYRYDFGYIQAGCFHTKKDFKKLFILDIFGPPGYAFELHEK